MLANICLELLMIKMGQLHSGKLWKPEGMHFYLGLPGGTSGKESSCNAEDTGDTGDVDLIPGSGRSPGEGNGNPSQYSCLENPMDRGAWWALQSMGLQRVGHN